MCHRMGDQYVHMVFDTDPLTDAPGLTDLDQDARLELESRVFVSNLLHSASVVYLAASLLCINYQNFMVCNIPFFITCLDLPKSI